MHNSTQNPYPANHPCPLVVKKFERQLWFVWKNLKGHGQFTVNDAYKFVTAHEGIKPDRPLSSYSAILSRWAELGYLDIIEKGSDRRPTMASSLKHQVLRHSVKVIRVMSAKVSAGNCALNCSGTIRTHNRRAP